MTPKSTSSLAILIVLAAGCSGPGPTSLGMPDATQTADAGADLVVTPDVATDVATDDGFDSVDLPRGRTGLAVDPTILQTSEDGTTATFDVWLHGRPIADVDVSITGATSEGSASPTSFRFDASNFDVPQTVTVTPVDDAVNDGPQTYGLEVALSSSDPLYDGLTQHVAVTNDDDDDVAVIVAPLDLTVSEGGPLSATFMVHLTTDPGETMVVELAPTDPTQLTLSSAQLEFDGTNFGTPQSLTVTAMDDAVADGDQLETVITTVGATQAYAGVAADDVLVNVLDDDSVGVRVTPTGGLVVDESGSTAAFSVVLASAPSAMVEVPLSVSDQTEGTITPPLLFTTANWDQPQVATVTGLADGICDGPQRFLVELAPLISADVLYDGHNPDDIAAVNWGIDCPIQGRAANGLVTTEQGGNVTFTVVLLGPILADVSIPLLSSDVSEGTVTPSNLVFLTSNWNVPQTVTVTGVDDAIVDGDVLYFIDYGATTSADPSFNSLSGPLAPVTNLDDD